MRRACKQILLVKEKLWKRRIIEDPLCSICGLEVEDTNQAFCSIKKKMLYGHAPGLKQCGWKVDYGT